MKMFVDSERCLECPDDRICAWHCQQGWNIHDILTEDILIQEGKLPPIKLTKRLLYPPKRPLVRSILDRRV